MSRLVRAHILALSILTNLFLIGKALAANEKDAAQLMRDGHFADAVTTYEALIQQQPKSVRLRLDFADALAKDRQWDRALMEYQAILQLSPGNAEALRGIGTIQGWRGHIKAAREAYQKARSAAPNDLAGTLGLADIETLDHDFATANSLYQDANIRWPMNEHVIKAEYDFRRKVNPRIQFLYEDDLSFRTQSGGFYLPLFSHEELGAEYQKETRLNYTTGTESYARVDKTLVYTHHFGLNHTLELRARDSEFEYPVFAAAPAYTTIQNYQEYRIRYSIPLVPEQVLRLSYTSRPTTLLDSTGFPTLRAGDTFTAQKAEIELNSRWSPRLQTLFGTGWLRDLDSNATSTANLVEESLLKLGFQYEITSRLDISGRYITNPDLDNSVNSTTILQAGYSLSDSIAFLARARLDDYKTGNDQNAYYVALRYTPNSHLWSEAGMKYVVRGAESGLFPLVSLIWRF